MGLFSFSYLLLDSTVWLQAFSVWGWGCVKQVCTVYMYVQCLGASALCPEVCTKRIFSESLKKFSVSKADVKEMGNLCTYMVCGIGGGRRGV